MTINNLSALSPLDGRYAARLTDLAALFSEAGLIHHRVRVEVEWLLRLADHPDFSPIDPPSPDDRAFLHSLHQKFSLTDAEAVKNIERTTNHDVKAIEYWIKQQLSTRPNLNQHAELVHFACTSEDINNLAWGLMLQAAIRDHLDPLLADLDRKLEALATEHADLAMLSRTHGQSATPTTLGKEMANVVFRLRRQRRLLNQVDITGKINGAVGNFNAHLTAWPELDWPRLGRETVEGLGLVWNPYTTQIEPHDMVAELAHALVRINTVLLDFARDTWAYISIGYFAQKAVEGEVGSSTMPHKINPIDFENGEGNLGLANALLEHLAAKLPVSRWQRDLTDSTVQRSIGSAFGYCSLAWQSIARGLDRITPDAAAIARDLDQAWEVLAEPIQTAMRIHGIDEPYEKLKALTRGQHIDQQTIATFVDGLDLPEPVRARLKALKPSDYTGNASDMAAAIVRYV